MPLVGFSRVLTWDDYTELDTAPPGHSQDAAQTFSGFGATKFTRTKNKAGRWVFKESDFTVTITLSATAKSWVIKGGKKVPALLQHEQGHYDITALAARQFFDAGRVLEADTSEGLSDALEKLRADTEAKRESLDTFYDEDKTCETNHGTDAHWQDICSMRIKAAKGDPKRTLDDLTGCPPPPTTSESKPKR